MASFNAKLRDELLNVESFDTLREVQVPVERWKKEYRDEACGFLGEAVQPTWLSSPAAEARRPWASSIQALPPRAA